MSIAITNAQQYLTNPTSSPFDSRTLLRSLVAEAEALTRDLTESNRQVGLLLEAAGLDDEGFPEDAAAAVAKMCDERTTFYTVLARIARHGIDEGGEWSSETAKHAINLGPKDAPALSSSGMQEGGSES